MQPLARKDKLTVRELPEETLVYDLESHRAHCLNRTSALVWKHCDGRHDVDALAAILARELGLPAREAGAAARLALEQLGRRQLLQEKVAPPLEEERVSRRTALRKLAKATAAALPLVMTLKSPSVAWATEINPCTPNSCPPGQTCTPDIRKISGSHISYSGSIRCTPLFGSSGGGGGGAGTSVDCTKNANAGKPCGGTKLCCGGACTDVQTDGSNCGTCGNFCASGNCSGGKCV